MGYIKFDREQLINLEYSLSKEIIRSNRAGSFISTTLNGCNTRKYHGLLVCPIQVFNNEKHVLLSTLDTAIIQKGNEFNLGIHRYQGGYYEPKGHMYLSDIQIDKVPKYTYSVGGVTLTMERLLVEREEQMLIRYTLVDTQHPVKLRFKPFLAFRNIHHLSKANMFANTRFKQAINGISLKMYENFPDLFMQFNKKVEFVPVPDWYYNIEYQKELTRGYEFLEDLFVPGFFELPVKKGESVIFSASTFEMNTPGLKKLFDSELNKRRPRESFVRMLENAAEQFVMHKNDETDIIAGFPWYDSITRQTFIALPGLDLCTRDSDLYEQVLKTYKKHLKDGLFPNQINSTYPVYNSVDAPLWYIWAIQQYFKKNKDAFKIWENYGGSIKDILNSFKKSKHNFINSTKDGLIYAEKDNTSLTWMNSHAYGTPVIQRAGMPVEVNALWYNAVCFSLEIAEKAGDNSFTHQWKGSVEKTGKAFLDTFLNDGHEHLADVVKGKAADWSVRPNMVIAAALDYTPLSKEQKKTILTIARQKLLTPRGLRSLSPDHIRFRGVVEGNPSERELAIHQGAVWPWLILFFALAWLNVNGTAGNPYIK